MNNKLFLQSTVVSVVFLMSSEWPRAQIKLTPTPTRTTTRSPTTGGPSPDIIAQRDNTSVKPAVKSPVNSSSATNTVSSVPDCYQSPDKKILIRSNGVSATQEKPIVNIQDGKKTETYQYPGIVGDTLRFYKVQMVTDEKSGIKYVVESASPNKNGEFTEVSYNRLSKGSDGECVLENRYDYASKEITYDRTFCSEALKKLANMKSCSDNEKELKKIVESTQARIAKTYQDVKFGFDSIEPQIQSHALKIGNFCAPYHPSAKDILNQFKQESEKPSAPIVIPGAGPGN
jgi:hypothetical protein